MSHPFDQAIALTPTGEATCTGATHAAYANMVGPFGGITAATLLQAVLQQPQREGDPIALTVNFAGPVAGGGFEVEARPARLNRSTQHWTATLRQGADIAATATVVCASRRETWSAAEAPHPADMPAREGLARFHRPGLPAWTRCYDMRFPLGEEPFDFDGQEQPHSQSRLWVRDEPPRPLDFPALAAMSDSFFPRVFVRRRRPAPIGTITLTTFFHADAGQLAAQGSTPLIGTARALAFRRGYFDQSAELWGADGSLFAVSHQMVYFRE